MAVALAALTWLPACSFFSPNPGNTFYISASGNNGAAGNSPSTAWRTLSRANSAKLKPGERLLLRGGDTFRGQLRFGPHDAGNPRKPLTIGSYGHGAATIVGSAESAVVVFDTSGVDIANLALVGTRASGTGSAGIKLFSDQPAHHRLRHVVIRNVNASGFGYGISLGAQNPAAGFANVQISHSALHNNLDAGLATSGPPFHRAAPSYAHTGIRIDHVSAVSNTGDPADTTSNTGSGIVLGNVSNAAVTWSTAAGNGGANATPFEGPIGMWAYASSGIVMQHDLSYGNRTASRRDGGGFGLDENTTNSYLQYDLAYGNDGAGFQVYAPNGAKNTGDVVRYDISSGDALRTINAAGIIVSGRVTGAQVYQNTVIMGPRPGGTRHSALWLGKIRRVTVRNNLFAVDHFGPIVIALHNMPRSSALLQGNDYYSTVHHWQLLWGLGSSYATLRAWRQATGQERTAGRATGLAVNPHLTGPVLGLSASDAGIAAGFIPASGSPLVRAGLNLPRLFGVNPGPVSYSGKPQSLTAPNIGAG